MVGHHNEARLSVLQRDVFDQINLIRRRFHLPMGRLTTAYQAIVNRAANDETDPFAPIAGRIFVEYGVWALVPHASSTTNAARIVDDWVYRDGWNGASTLNRDCTARNAPGCDAHRRAILSSPPLSRAHLYIDVGGVVTARNGFAADSVAALLIWELPT